MHGAVTLFLTVLIYHIAQGLQINLLAQNQMNQSLVKSLVICGPSGVGKGTTIGKLLSNHPTKFGLSVSRTSRKPREGEIDGVHYHFVDKETILQDIKFGKFKYIEHAEVHSNIYGTREDAVTSIHDAGKVCILDVDTEGVRQMKKNMFSAKYIFMTPLSIDVLEERLRNRGTETEAQIQLRLKNAKGEIEYGKTVGLFDEILVNDKVDETYNKLVDLIRLWFPWTQI